MGILDRKTTSTQNVVNETVTTTNVSTVRDIGVTGQHAVGLAQVVSKAGVESRSLATEEFALATQMQGEGFSQLVGGANYLTQTSAETGARILDASSGGLADVRRAGQEVFDSAGGVVKNALSVARETILSSQTGGVSAFIPIIGLGIAAYVLMQGLKRG